MSYKTLLMFIRNAVEIPRVADVWLDAIHKALRFYETKKYARCGANRTGRKEYEI